ncbi:MAG: OmpA family protein [Pseudomonadota bacterium]
MKPARWHVSQRNPNLGPTTLAPFISNRLSNQRWQSGWRSVGLLALAALALIVGSVVYLGQNRTLAATAVGDAIQQAPRLVADLNSLTKSVPQNTASRGAAETAESIGSDDVTDTADSSEKPIAEQIEAAVEILTGKSDATVDVASGSTADATPETGASAPRDGDPSSLVSSGIPNAQSASVAGIGVNSVDPTFARSVPFAQFAPPIEAFGAGRDADETGQQNDGGTAPKIQTAALRPGLTAPPSTTETTAEARRDQSSCRQALARLARASTVWFPIGTATLTPESETQLRAFATEFKGCGNVLAEVGGHTDRLGADGLNFALSWKRAETVARLLTTNGVEAERLSVVGFGPRRPLARPGQSPLGDPAALNRRVEIILR